jgi:hypothetical protein
VREEPAVWVWNRSAQLRDCFAPSVSRATEVQSRRAARNFAISSRKLRSEEKKNERRGRNSSGSSPRATAARA